MISRTKLWLCFVFCILLAGHLASASDGRCHKLFEAEAQNTTPSLDSLFPSLADIQKEMILLPNEQAWTPLNRRLDRLYLNVARTDLLQIASDDLLLAMTLRILEVQKEIETGVSRNRLQAVFANAQQDTLQDVKGLVYKELRRRGLLRTHLETAVPGPLSPLLQRDLLIQFGLFRTDRGDR